MSTCSVARRTRAFLHTARDLTSGSSRFPISEVTLNSNPLKAREYLAAGLPVVSTAIPEVEVLGLCQTARNREEFLRLTEEALEDGGPSQQRSEMVRDQSWSTKLAEVTEYVKRYL